MPADYVRKTIQWICWVHGLWSWTWVWYTIPFLASGVPLSNFSKLWCFRLLICKIRTIVLANSHGSCEISVRYYVGSTEWCAWHKVNIQYLWVTIIIIFQLLSLLWMMTGYTLTLHFPESLQICPGSALDRTTERHLSQAPNLHLADLEWEQQPWQNTKVSKWECPVEMVSLLNGCQTGEIHWFPARHFTASLILPCGRWWMNSGQMIRQSNDW